MDHIFSTSALHITLILLTICEGISGAKFTVINRCDYTVWPGILSNAGSTPLDSTGFELPRGGSRSFQAPPNWSGRFWGRTGCTFDPNTGQGTCVTGDCSSNQIECDGKNANPPATLAEFTVGSGGCLSTGCMTDLNQQCPTELRVESGQACKSACEAFGSPEYCCSGAYGAPDTCKPSVYSEMFKTACPRSYSYAYDDATSTFTCIGADYVITFCPSSTSQKSARDTTPPASTANGAETGSGSGDGPIGIDTSWLPNFLTGDSPGAFSCCAWQFDIDFFCNVLFIPLFGLFIASTLDKCTCSLSGHLEFVLHWKERLIKSRL
ncbi:hypothetical protein OIU84_005132 [Salix udensis]|uniref:Uncharacterized protein n=1 Tax=Salix udensis TaxID=889485 RepID=A0AAD6JVD2_9ROSI|nr:hypothetical protein OIU84_005132 [Salix udensis]